MSKHPNNVKHQKRLALKRGSATAPKFEHRLKIKDLYFGSIDANDEIQAGGPQSAEDFYRTFYMPSDLSIDKFLKGEKFFVYGLKGTGKTSLLRYLMEYIKRNVTSKVSPEFFPFSKSFPKNIYEDVREQFLNGIDLEAAERSALFRNLDYQDVWIYILLKRISEVITDRNNNTFLRNNDHSVFCKYMSSISKSEERTKIVRFLPNIKSGKVILSKDPSFEIELDFDDPSSREISFYKYTRKALQLYSQLSFQEGSNFYLMIDEIDPRISSGVMFEMDCILIRDLIVAIRDVNLARTSKDRGVYVIAAIRSEILTKVHLLGKEIHKRLEQFGYCFNWGDLGKASIDHPLIQLICLKIAYSEQKSGSPITLSDQSAIVRYIWPRYFRKNKNLQLDPKELLDWTWYRPRDIVRLFQASIQADPNSEEISESIINRGSKRYSNNSWTDIEAQLSLAIDPLSIAGVNSILTRFKREFSHQEFEERIEAVSIEQSPVARIRQKYKTNDIIVQLYLSGAIGNISGSRVRFVYRGDTEVDLGGRFYVHRALLPKFAISTRR